MVLPPSNKTGLVDQLLTVLDEEIDLLDLRRIQMEELHDLILHSDENRMECLLREIEEAQQRQFKADNTLASVRTALACLIGEPNGKIRLEQILPHLELPARRAVSEKRQELIRLAQKLREQHLTTAMLLIESLRVNRLLLEGMFPKQEVLQTYDASGMRGWHKGPGLVDMEY